MITRNQLPQDVRQTRKAGAHKEFEVQTESSTEFVYADGFEDVQTTYPHVGRPIQFYRLQRFPGIGARKYYFHTIHAVKSVQETLPRGRK
jgi:hypothetical protein